MTIVDIHICNAFDTSLLLHKVFQGAFPYSITPPPTPLMHDPYHIVLPPYKAKTAAKRPKAPATEAPTRTFSAAAEEDFAAAELVAVPDPVETPRKLLALS